MSSCQRDAAVLTWGLRPPDPLTRSLAGAPGPAPLAWLARCAHSLCHLIHKLSSLAEFRRSGRSPRQTRARWSAARRGSLTAGLRPSDPLTRSLAGAPGPAPLAWLARCAHSLCHLIHKLSSLAEFRRSGRSPRQTPARWSAPRRGSLTAGLRPPAPLTRSLAGAPGPAPRFC